MPEITVSTLTDAILAAEARLSADLLQVVFFGDGSGHVLAMAPGPTPDTRDAGCFEPVAEFQTPGQAIAWLAVGTLPDEPVAEPFDCRNLEVRDNKPAPNTPGALRLAAYIFQSWRER